MEKINLFDVRRECRLCGKKYPVDGGMRLCNCGGFLYVTGAYWPRKAGRREKGGQGDSRPVLRDERGNQGYQETKGTPGAGD